MLIERTPTEVIIRLPATVNLEGLQRLVDYPTCKEATAESWASQADVDELAKDVKEGWWSENRHVFLK